MQSEHCSTNRQHQTCRICHKPRTSVSLIIDGHEITRPHKYLCSKIRCTDSSCGYSRGHPELRAAVKARIKSNRAAVKLAKEQKEALLAGMKAPTSTEFTQVMQQTFEQAGLDRKSIPGPATLSLVVDSVQQFTNTNRPIPPSKKKKGLKMSPSSTSIIPSSQIPPKPSVNAVVQLLENGYPTAHTQQVKRWQCRHCSFIQVTPESMQEHGQCEVCEMNMVSLARADAVTSPAVMKQALSSRATLLATESISHPSVTSTSTTSHPIPQVWPVGKKCSVCEDMQAVKYCACCRSYICGAVSCLNVVHDEEAARVFGCQEKDMHVITTRSGRPVIPRKFYGDMVSGSPADEEVEGEEEHNTLENDDDDMDEVDNGEDNDDDDETSDDDIVVMGAVSKKPAFTHSTANQMNPGSIQTYVQKMDVGVQTNHNMIYKPLYMTNGHLQLEMDRDDEDKENMSHCINARSAPPAAKRARHA